MTKSSSRIDDTTVVQVLNKLLSILQQHSMEYMIFGSCGLQSYLPSFYKTPNDIDLIVRKDQVRQFQLVCEREGYEIQQENGRFKVITNNFPIHVIPGVFSIINKVDESVFYAVDFEKAFPLKVKNSMRLICEDQIITADVLPIDYCLFLELSRKITTNIYLNVCGILSNPALKMADFMQLYEEHEVLQGRISERISMIADIYRKYGFPWHFDHVLLSRNTTNLFQFSKQENNY